MSVQGMPQIHSPCSVDEREARDFRSKLDEMYRLGDEFRIFILMKDMTISEMRHEKACELITLIDNLLVTKLNNKKKREYYVQKLNTR
jgi:hypothetical protein